MPCSTLRRASSSNIICLAMFSSPCLRVSAALADDRQDLALLHDLELLAVDLDVGAAVLRVEDDVADFDGDLDHAAVREQATAADREDLALRRLLLRGVREQDPARRLLLGLERLDHDMIAEGFELHLNPP